jgi:hypothetical protein
MVDGSTAEMLAEPGSAWELIEIGGEKDVMEALFAEVFGPRAAQVMRVTDELFEGELSERVFSK